MAQSFHTDFESYKDNLAKLLAGPGPHFAIYSADLVDGQPWCPDCVRTLPAVKEGIAKAGGSLLEVRVGPKTAWKTPDHPFRHAPLKLTGIPTLIHFKPDGTEATRIGPELEAAGSPAEAEAVVAGFLQRLK